MVSCPYSIDTKLLTKIFLDFDDLGSAPSTPHYAIDGKTPISNITYSDLQRQIQDLNVQVSNHRSFGNSLMKFAVNY